MIGVLLVLVLSGCATTTLVSSEKTAGIPTRQYRTLLVVGLSETPATRQVFEEVFGDELRKRGINAVSSYTIEGLRGKTTPTRTAFVEALKTTGADGLLTTRFVRNKNKKDTKSGFVMTGRGTDVVDYYDYYGGYWEGIENYATFDAKPVDEIISSVTTLETALFDAETGRVAWKGTANETNADKLIQSTRELAGLVLDALSKEGLLTGK
jgi:hypothetical protein